MNKKKKKLIVENTKKAHKIHIFLDLDGTVADLYKYVFIDLNTGLKNAIENELIDFSKLPMTDFGQRLVNVVTENDVYTDNIVWHVLSFVPEGASDKYKEIVAQQKKSWVYNNLWFVPTNNVHILDHDKNEKKTDFKKSLVYEGEIIDEMFNECFNVLIDDYDKFLYSWENENEDRMYKSVAIDVNDGDAMNYVVKLLITNQIEQRLKPSWFNLLDVIKKSFKRVFKLK